MKSVKSVKILAAAALAVVERAGCEGRLTKEEVATLTTVLKEMMSPKRGLAAVGSRGKLRRFHV